ncbi:esterase E4 isoform X1 [Bradysia coprophila]|uniref:esterase E4 isoform X1 n=2 Tax=Bradysia coprophila TaxID=38358 RepID=UPI00187D9795|nr:esterase E4 isoform X1 [Bradysia coprophila]
MINAIRNFNIVCVSKRFVLFGRMISSQSSPQITLNQGTVIGVEEKLPNGNAYYTYKGIPYAEPPLGKLRFKDPIPLSKFSENILDCTKERDVSHHKDLVSAEYVGSENCLHLNVYSPLPPRDSSINTSKLAVLVWIHGGAFMSGSGNTDYYSPEYLVQENVVVVTLNYRLGVLGFLCLPEAGVPGNAGLKDQLEALKWVNRNISKFGGDASNVTLFGESAGAGSVGLHMLSDKSRKYFHKAICQSGSSLHEWLIQPDPVGKSKRIAELLGFEGGSQTETLDYLQGVEDLNGFQKHFGNVLSADEKRRGLPLCFKPCIEIDTPNAILTKSPLELMNRPNSVQIPVMIGYNSAEGIITLLDIYKKFDAYDKDIGRMIPRSLNVPNDSSSQPESLKLAELIRKFYFDGQTISKELLSEMSDLQTDYHFAIGAQLYAEMHCRRHPNSPLYFYRFAYDGKLNMFKKLLIVRQKALKQVKGACHGDELFYLFNLKIVDIERLEKSVSTRVASEMCKMWTNFAKYGEPTPSTETSLSVKWDPVQPAKDGEKFVLDYLEIDERSRMLTDPDNDRITFWRNLYEKWNGGFLKPKL